MNWFLWELDFLGSKIKPVDPQRNGGEVDQSEREKIAGIKFDPLRGRGDGHAHSFSTGFTRGY
ncbi:hypothetical protein [Algoriphagus boritolerans]|uniref:Uncharacterized protein n=1 Tax=Algoriphagus boritolerans DSM 17298 = JCM 18970 TaxID=1120964 RepID=A0A1H6AKF7_9BACT|nr:hypothetical protein [Algoriphagus boritolerans]SEG48892.1 hypothetical protein SAMN03080598_04186 [Algoriphagus boritolerans DSM 17298 = JCM 18970]